MEPLILRAQGHYEVLFTMHLRAPDPDRRAPRGERRPVQGDDYRGRPECTTWTTLNLRAERLPIEGAEEMVRIEPAPRLRPEDGPALRRCAARALAALPATFLCDPQDREDLDADDSHHLMAFLEPAGYEALVSILGYFVFGFGADYPFMDEDPDRQKIRALVEGFEAPRRAAPL